MTKPTVSKHWRKPVDCQYQAWITPETLPSCCYNTIVGNRLYAQRKGPSVTNKICLTCKNYSYKCAVDYEHRAVLIIFPPSLQTISITRMLSSGAEAGILERTKRMVKWSAQNWTHFRWNPQKFLEIFKTWRTNLCMTSSHLAVQLVHCLMTQLMSHNQGQNL